MQKEAPDAVSVQILFANMLSSDKMLSTVHSFDLKGVEWTDVRSATFKQRKKSFFALCDTLPA